MHTAIGMSPIRSAVKAVALSFTLATAACGGTETTNTDDAPAGTSAGSMPAEPADSRQPASTSRSDSAVPEPSAPATPESPITLYTVSGTFVGPRDGFAADIAKAVDPALFTWEPIDYPASAFPMDASAAQGVANLVNRINARPGKFALLGYSQGALVISKVYEELRSGSLQNRRQDFVAGVALGNPMRESGHTIPGGTDPGGHGITAQRLVGSEDLWWDFCSPNDTICTTGDDLVGRDYTAIFDILMTSFTGQGDILSVVLSALANPLEALSQLPALAQLTTQLLGIITGTSPEGHGAYPVDHPIQGNPLTSIELATQHLNEKAKGP
jgi:hypothetical protein